MTTVNAFRIYAEMGGIVLAHFSVYEKSPVKKIKPLHKTPVKKIPKPAVDFDRDKNLSYLPQDESLDPLLEYPVVYEADVERPITDTDRGGPQKFETDERPLPDRNNTDA